MKYYASTLVMDRLLMTSIVLCVLAVCHSVYVTLVSPVWQKILCIVTALIAFCYLALWITLYYTSV